MIFLFLTQLSHNFLTTQGQNAILHAIQTNTNWGVKELDISVSNHLQYFFLKKTIYNYIKVIIIVLFRP
jgi:hypothetical protein